MAAAKKLGVIDALFLAAETRESMMHVGGLLVFTPPPDAPSGGFLRALADGLRDQPEVQPPWNLELRRPEMLKNPLNTWVEDKDFDLDYHVRRSALPSPGDERELGILVSRLHGIQMDFHRPLWEVHFIEGLAGGRFAMYFKVHHALLDGYTGMRMLAASLSADPDERGTSLFFARPPRTRLGGTGGAGAPTLSALFEALRGQAGAMRDVGRAIANVVRASRAKDRSLVAPLSAPRSILNRRISRNRRFATQQFDFERVKRVARTAGGTVNDVILALSGAAIRRLLLDLGELPQKPLIAMLPVNVRPKDDPGGGNAVAAILASLATDIADPTARLQAIIQSTTRAKEQLQGMSRGAILQYSALLMAPLSIQLSTGTAGRTKPAFNVVISNVPGPENPLYFNGARLDALYAASIPFHGYGLNITITSYAGTLNFGFTGCRDTLPHLQRLAVYSGEALEELERQPALASA
ncbi:MAG TPA: wax ester/triacylglycerol synthase family O-acyltransferase [Kofleriaceae bacterium]|nr:wax ester/triacylglycerol synthase family O-acyltransferase [Kofleriaceae bacterium]